MIPFLSKSFAPGTATLPLCGAPIWEAAERERRVIPGKKKSLFLAVFSEGWWWQIDGGQSPGHGAGWAPAWILFSREAEGVEGSAGILEAAGGKRRDNPALFHWRIFLG